MKKEIYEHSFIEIRCGCTDKKGLSCTNFLGYFQKDGFAHISMYYCKFCKRLIIYEVDNDGRISRDVTDSKEKIGTCETLAIMM